MNRTEVWVEENISNRIVSLYHRTRLRGDHEH
jgi:hypothetical protein